MMATMRERRLQVEGTRWLCRALSPATTREAILARWPRTELWPAIVAGADRHRLITALAVAVERHDLADRLDAELADLLAAVAAWNAERNEGLRRQMLSVTRALNAQGVRPIWLKGALQLVAPDGPASGRIMNDLDLWIPAEPDQQAALEVLVRLGYAPPEGQVDDSYFDPGYQHFPPYFHPDEMARLELHRSVVVARKQSVLPNAEAAQGVEWLDWEGTRIGRLDALFGALSSFLQCTRTGRSGYDDSDIPLFKAFDFVGRLHADFDGRVPPVLVEHVTRAGWEPTARRLFTLIDVYFGVANPLPANWGLVRALEGRVLRPRLQVALHSAGRLMSGRGLRLLLRPSLIPAAVAAVHSRLRSAGTPPVCR